MDKRTYLKAGLSRVYLDPARFYSKSQIYDLLHRENLLPPERTKQQVTEALRAVFNRNIPDEFLRRPKREVLVLGAILQHYVDSAKMPIAKVRKHLNQAMTNLADQEKKNLITLKAGYTRGHRPIRFRYSLALPLILAVGTILVAFYSNREILYGRRGPAVTIEDLNGQAFRSNQENYDLIHSLYEVGNLEEAARGAHTLLSHRNLSPSVEGDTFLLLSRIYKRQGDYVMAQRMVEAAIRGYKGMPEHTEMLFRARTNLGQINAALGEYSEALIIFSTLFELHNSQAFKGFLALQASDACFWMGDFHQALEWNEKAHAYYLNAGNRSGIGNAQMNRGWLMAITGEAEKAYIPLDEAERIAVALGDINRQSYIKLARKLAEACLTGELPTLEEFPARVLDDHDFLKYFEFVKTTPCSNDRIVEDDPPIPSDPPPSGGGKKEAHQRSREAGKTVAPSLDRDPDNGGN